MDNRQFDITAQSDEELLLALKIAFKTNFGDRTAVGYEVVDNTLIFYWSDVPTMSKALYPIKVEYAFGMVQGWLETVKPSENRPDIDGDAESNAFRVYCDFWGHVNGKWQAFVGIQPKWAWYGK
jgi:hypothetical protein